MKILGLGLSVLLAVGCGDSEPTTDGSGTTTGTDDAAEVGGTTDADGMVADGVATDDVPEPNDEGADDDAAPTEETEAPDEGPDIPEVLCVEGTPCDDLNPCTAKDKCTPEGVCAGQAYACDDERACTSDTCLGDGDCVFEVNAGTCLIANVCYQPGDGHPDNPCVTCAPGESSAEWTLAPNGQVCDGDGACLLDATCTGGTCSWGVVTCDDQNPCTDDVCDLVQGCLHTNNFDACEDGDPCSIGDFCKDAGCLAGLIPLVCNDGEPCTNDVCGPDGCLFIPKSGLCSDGTECTQGDHCTKGKCQPGTPISCADGNVCTVDKCDPFIGCAYELVDSACCVAGKSLCDDQNTCTTDVCDELEATCKYTENQANCDDGLPCTGPDSCLGGACGGGPLECDDFNACTEDSCIDAEGGCVFAPLEADCDDDNLCTEADHCTGGTCIGKPKPCGDGDTCTKDSCAPESGCVSELVVGPCNDSNACTGNDTCGPNGCVGIVKSCNDQNACTNDSCNPVIGCQHQAIGGPCDDGLSCSAGDACVAGECVSDLSSCGCLPEFGDVVTKLTQLVFGEGGNPGQGLNVDGAASCAPTDNCSAGVDNQMAKFSFLANEPMTDAVVSGKIVLLLEHKGFDGSAKEYTLNFYPGDSIKGSSCNVQADVCDYEVKTDGIDEETCEAIITFDNAKITGTTLSAGGKGYVYPLELPINDAIIPVEINNAQLQGEVTVVGNQVTLISAVLGGAIPKQTFLDGIDLVPASDLPEKDAIKQLLTVLIQNDIDTNNDGQPDAASIGLVMKGIPGHILGLEN